jgi:dihydroxyacetone kinase DhaKLM complex PTS-EIIA-like component DhaM
MKIIDLLLIVVGVVAFVYGIYLIIAVVGFGRGALIGLVIVSHSKALANSLAELVRQIVSMAHELPIAACGGAGDDHQEFGTDAIEIMEAIQSFSDLDGILILADLGSAVLSAETALDLIPEELRQKVMICPGPLLWRGAISAGVPS